VSVVAELELEGMTCAACAARIEKRLNRLDGVEAAVNFATESARVAYDPARTGAEDLFAAVEAAGYGAVPAGTRKGDERPDVVPTRLAVAVALGFPLVLIAMLPPLHFAGWRWVALALAKPVVWWAGWDFHRAAVLNARLGAATMDTLVSLGTLAAWTWSVTALALGRDDTYFEVAAVIVALILLGRALESRARRRSGAALRALAERGAKEARILRDGREVVVPAADLQAGEQFVVQPGEKLAADGIVEDGAAALDVSLLTGEPLPVEVGPGSEVAGGTVNTNGRLVVRATRVGADTAIARIARLVAEAQAGKAPVQPLADRVSGVFVPVVIVIALATLLGRLLAGGSAGAAFTAAVAVLIIACPCALGLATPTALLVGSGRGAQLGLLIRGPEILERTRRITTVVLDKTGTVTEGRMQYVDDGLPPEALRLAGAVEAASEHPIARAVAEAARERFGACLRSASSGMSPASASPASSRDAASRSDVRASSSTACTSATSRSRIS